MLLFRLHQSKTPTVNSTSSAMLRQATTMVFDRTVGEYHSCTVGNKDHLTENRYQPETTSNSNVNPPPSVAENPASSVQDESSSSGITIIITRNIILMFIKTEKSEGTPLQAQGEDRSASSPPPGMGIVVGNKAPSSLRPYGRDAYP